MAKPALLICRDPDELAQTAASAVSRSAARSILERGKFTIALAGGSTPERAYRLLAHGVGQTSVDWNKTFLFLGDERVVPRDDSRSNFKMANDALLSIAPIPGDHVFPVPTELASPPRVAEAYAATLAQFFGTAPGVPPQFDLILLGLGDDGHTASLFPHAPALHVSDATVTSSPPGTLPPPVDRVTLTFPVLNAAREVLFLVAGANKAAALADIWSGGASTQVRPAAGVHPAGMLTWIVDQAAARSLPKDS